MTKNNRLYLGLVFVIATVVIVYFMPRVDRHKYAYELNRPWNYSLLTAPFDITVYRDSATVKAMTDSVERTMVPIYRRDDEVQTRVLAAVNGADSLSVTVRRRLTTSINTIYERGVVDQATATLITSGQLPEVKFNVDNVNTSMATSGFMSQRDAYAMLDSLNHDLAGHRSIQALGLADLLLPNIVEDEEATQQYHDALIQPIVAGIGIIQKGERIIAQGDIVTPQLYQILQSYETTLEKQSNHDRQRQWNMLIGHALFVMSLLGMLYVFMLMYYPVKLAHPREVLALMLLLVLFFVFTVGINRTIASGIYLSPLAILPIMVSVFYDARTAFFLCVLETLLCSVLATFPLEFVTIELTAGTAVIFSIKELSRRSELLRSAAIALVGYVLAYLGIELMTTGSLSTVSWRIIGFFGVNAVLVSFAYVLILIFEKLFGMVSVVTLVELSDINTTLLRQLSQECPGTFQHSMSVSNLATEAAHRIGANVQIVRAGALYHDIGKIDNPAFFTENQYGVNPHDALTPLQSAKIITRHVTDGLRRAEKEKLPGVIRDLIVQHHGCGKAKYFYNTYCMQHPDEDVDPAPFTYPGPNPQTKEASVLMMADTVEAASRSLTDHSPESIRALVNRLIDAQVTDGLHNDSPLSFRDIKEIKECFIQRLRSMYHARVSYPADVKRKVPGADDDNHTDGDGQNKQ
jgi:hypothetical protein